jgi:uncharacterized membrane protein YgdD (TMEM256/DUF423 family)
MLFVSRSLTTYGIDFSGSLRCYPHVSGIDVISMVTPGGGIEPSTRDCEGPNALL